MSESPRRPGLDQEEDRISGTGAAILTAFGVFMVAIAMWAGVHIVESIGGKSVTPSTAQETSPRTEKVRPIRAIGAIDVTQILEDSSTRTDRELRKKRLEAYGWADRQRGLVTIPIDRAMQLVVERAGNAAAAPPQQGATGGPSGDSAADSGTTPARGKRAPGDSTAATPADPGGGQEAP